MKKAIIFVGYACNESCFFCSAEVEGRKHINKSTHEIFIDILKMKKGGTEEIEFIGGEVFMRKDILIILAFAKKVGFTTISIETNGEFFSDLKKLEQFLKLGLNQITVSIHGCSPEVNDFHTKVKGSFNRKILGLKNLLLLHEKYNFRVNTNFVVTSKNVHEVPQFIALMDTFPMIRNYIFAFVRPLKKYAAEYKDYLPTFTSIKENFEIIGLHKKVRIQYLPHCILNHDINELFQKGMEKGLKNETVKINENPDENLNLENAIQYETMYLDGCNDCPSKRECRGIWKEYIDYFQIKTLPLINTKH